VFDVVIRNGSIVDGTGAPRFAGDVAVKDGNIVAVGRVEGEAGRVIDAAGCIVTPGFVDVHTHYDGQVTWDETLEPSTQHGVTTMIAGNCGVGFAPVLSGQEKWLVQLMEGVEDIPGTALYEGITWGWETFPEYLDQLESRTLSADIGIMIAHGPVRAYSMGDRGARNEDATTEDIAAMARVVREAIEAGAYGFSTSRTLGHRARDGEPVPGTFAGQEELFAIAEAIRDGGGSYFEVAPQGIVGEEGMSVDNEVAWMTRAAEQFGITFSFAVTQNSAQPTAYKRQLEAAVAAQARGLRVVPQVAARPFGMLLGFPSYHAFAKKPTYVELAARCSYDELIVELAKPAVRDKILAEADLPADPSIQFDGLTMIIGQMLDKVFVLGDPPDYEPTPEMSVAATARRAGVDPLRYFYDLLLEKDGKNLTMAPFLNYVDGDEQAIYEMITCDAAVMGLSDGGAHCRMICDASIPTYLLTHWARDRYRGPKLSLEYVVRRQTSETAALVGLTDRGTIAVGQRADLNVIDFDRLQLLQPRPADDLPAGGRRLLQDAVGYKATMVKGQITRLDGKDTGARPGRLLRA
jgi:N-acyl-D-aspartate/D-glutamate deacylase